MKRNLQKYYMRAKRAHYSVLNTEDEDTNTKLGQCEIENSTCGDKNIEISEIVDEPECSKDDDDLTDSEIPESECKTSNFQVLSENIDAQDDSDNKMSIKVRLAQV